HGRADLVQIVGGGEGVDGLVVDVALDVDLGEVAFGERTGGVLEVGEPVAQRVELRVDDLVGNGRGGHLHPRAQVVLQLDHGTHLEDSVELDVAAFLSGGDVDVGRGDRVEVLRLDGVGVVPGEGIPERLVAGDVGAEAGFEELAGRLAGAEARDLDLSGQLAERGVDRPLELR